MAESKNFDFKISNPNSDIKTKKLYEYICNNFGKFIMVGQQESPWIENDDTEINYIYNLTGKLPAIKGFDFVGRHFKDVEDGAIKWAKQGGIVTICCHTGIKNKTYEESLSDIPDFSKLLKDGTSENMDMMLMWDKIADILIKLKNAKIPVLWRPFHEADAEWFWWGKGGSENFVKLWKKMYNYFSYEKGLNNLIWVMGYSDKPRQEKWEYWYPGDEYCDIIGSDIYDGSTNINAWKMLQEISVNKPMAFVECGKIPYIEEFEKDEAIWSYFVIWRKGYLENNDAERLKAIYDNDRVITLDKLPKF